MLHEELVSGVGFDIQKRKVIVEKRNSAELLTECMTLHAAFLLKSEHILPQRQIPQQHVAARPVYHPEETVKVTVYIAVR